MEGNNFYIATYSNVDVYECFIDGVPLMRRVSDDWVNATQILKAAKFPKAHRTRILEREVQNGVHEKIQGGYGRFQGTWIPLDVARPLAHRYNITDDMAPILSYVPDPSNPLERKSKTKPNSQHPNSSMTDAGNTPVKKPRKVYNTKKRREAAAAAAAMAAKEDDNAQSKQLPSLTSTDGRSFWQQNQSLEAQRQTAHPPQQNFQQQLPPPPPLPQFRQMHPNNYQIPLSNGQYVPTPNTYSYVQAPHAPQAQQQQYPLHPVHEQQYVQQPQSSYPYQQHKQRGSNENWSQDDGSIHMDDAIRDSDTSISSDHSSTFPNDTKGKAAYTEALINYFSTESDIIPAVLNHPPADFDFDEPIDDEGHTPLHWASSMASPSLIELLLKHGADPLVPNSGGLNSVSRAVYFNNSYQKRNFHVIVELLKNCIYTPDRQGRTPLHYLCESTTSKAEITKYYVKTIIERLQIENGNLIKVVVNHKDINKESAVDLAKKSSNAEVIEIFRPFELSNTPETVPKDHHADSYDVNNPKKATTDFIKTQGPEIPNLPLEEVGPILTSMLSSLADAYDTELRNKEEESQHFESVLEKLKSDVHLTEEQNQSILEQLDSGSSFEELEARVNELESICETKSQQLNNILERSQSLNLAKLVLKKESALTSIEEGLDQRELATELTKLQLKRSKIIDNIILEYTNHNINQKMENYRKLISISCALKVESIDDLIDEIEADLLTTVSQRYE